MELLTIFQISSSHSRKHGNFRNLNSDLFWKGFFRKQTFPSSVTPIIRKFWKIFRKIEFSKIITIQNLSRKLLFLQGIEFRKSGVRKNLKISLTTANIWKCWIFKKLENLQFLTLLISKNFFKKEIYKLPTTGSSYTSPWKFCTEQKL